MMKSIIALAVTMFVFYGFAHSQFQSDPHCLCNDLTIQSAWGSFQPTGPCQGCPGLQPGSRTCLATISGVIQPPTKCRVNQPCTSRCLGAWSQWNNVGICPFSCQQLQARFCYRTEIFGTRVRTNSCVGANGRMEQNRTVSCNHGNCDTSGLTTTRRSRVATTAATRTVPTNLSKDSERTTSGPLDEVDSIKQTDKIQINPLTEDAGSATNILLPAILGSVGILGFVAIAIAISIMWSRKKRPNTDYPSYASGTTTTTIRNENYESVGPPLPYRVTATAPVMPDVAIAQPENVPNLLYHPMDGTETLPAPKPSKTDSGAYLIPVEGTYREDPESIYSHIDENR